MKEESKRNELLQKAKEARRAYYRKWRKENPDKVKQYQETYWIKKAQETL